MIKNKFPNNGEEATNYGGFLYENNIFCKIFDFNQTLEQSLEDINTFLIKNGYERVEKLDDELSFENKYFSISKHGYQEQLVLFINRDIDKE